MCGDGGGDVVFALGRVHIGTLTAQHNTTHNTTHVTKKQHTHTKTNSDYPLDSLDVDVPLSAVSGGELAAPEQKQSQQQSQQQQSQQQQQQNRLNSWQERHARLMLERTPSLQDLRFVLCPR